MSQQPWFDQEVGPPKEPPVSYEPPRRGLGCWWTCLIVAVVALVVAVAAATLIALGVRRFIRSTIDQYTDPTPIAIEVVELPEDQLTALQDRVQAFEDILRDPDEQAATLTLNSDELNGLINADPEARGKVHLEILDDKIRGKASVPLSSFGSLLKGRYFNGEVTFRLAWENDQLDVRIDEALFKGQPLPEEIQAELKDKNLLEDQDVEQLKRLRGLEKIVVKDGTITLIAKPRSQRADLKPPAEEPTPKQDGQPPEPRGESTPKEEEGKPSEPPPDTP